MALMDSARCLRVSAKSLDVMTSQDKLFIHAKIDSDIRPVFSDGSQSPLEAVIFHNLQITYSQNGDRKPIFLSLDNNDLKVLKKAIEQAEAKLPSLSLIIQKAGVKEIRVAGE